MLKIMNLLIAEPEAFREFTEMLIEAETIINEIFDRNLDRNIKRHPFR